MSGDNHDLATGVAIALCASLLLVMFAIKVRVEAMRQPPAVHKTEIFPFCARAGAATWEACRVRP